jgi:hypothetical protein
MECSDKMKDLSSQMAAVSARLRSLLKETEDIKACISKHVVNEDVGAQEYEDNYTIIQEDEHEQDQLEQEDEQVDQEEEQVDQEEQEEQEEDEEISYYNTDMVAFCCGRRK